MALIAISWCGSCVAEENIEQQKKREFAPLDFIAKSEICTWNTMIKSSMHNS